MDNDEDDDGNFTKWMSSYWGHGGRDERAKEHKRSFMRSRHSTHDRRASLPCMSQLQTMRLKHPSTPVHLKRHEEETEVRSHPHARRASSDEYRGNKPGEAGPVPELTETFRRVLGFHNPGVPSPSDSDNACLICHEEMCSRGGERGRGGQGFHCSHCVHQEVRRLEQGTRPRSRSSAAVRENRKEVLFCPEQKEYHLPRQRRSLRRQR